MTTTYRITNTISGADLGTYEADSAEGARLAMVQAAGYATVEEAEEAAPTEPGEILVEEA